MEGNPILKQIQNLKKNGQWEDIIKLLHAENGFNMELPIDQLKELGFAYSRRASNLLEISFKLALHNLLLAEGLFVQLLQDSRTDEKQRAQYIKTLAYLYYTLYTNTSIWGNRFREKQYDAEVYRLVKENGVRRDYIGNKALLMYWQALQDDSRHVKTLYRAARLLEKMQIAVSFGSTKWDKYNFAAGAEGLIEAAGVNTQKYNDFLAKLNLRYFFEKRIEYLECAIKVYEESDADVQKSSFNEYIKALYNSCVYYIKNVESFYQKEQDKFEALDYWACSPKTEMIPAWCQAAFGKKEIVRKRLADVLRWQGIGCHNVEQQAEKIAMLDVPEQANFVYYRIADYIRYYKIVRNENLEQSVKQCLQFYYYAALVDFYIMTDAKHDKAHFNEPYIKLGTLLSMLDMQEELQVFSRKFKLSDAHYNYIRNVGDVCKSVHEGNFVKAERRMADLKRLRVNSAEKNVIAMLERRLNAFKNNPEGVEKARRVKDMEILLRNAFDELRGVMFG